MSYILLVTYFEWNAEKNEQLKIQRDVSFEDVVLAIQEERVLDTINHPNQKKYSNQQMLVIDIKNYVYLVPLVRSEEKVFLKTIIPSRKATKTYLISKKRRTI